MTVHKNNYDILIDLIKFSKSVLFKFNCCLRILYASDWEFCTLISESTTAWFCCNIDEASPSAIFFKNKKF